jgi:hypothetical protein
MSNSQNFSVYNSNYVWSVATIWRTLSTKRLPNYLVIIYLVFYYFYALSAKRLAFSVLLCKYATERGFITRREVVLHMYFSGVGLSCFQLET